MFGLLMIAFLVVPLLELYLFVEVSQAIGFGDALLWIVIVSVLGAWLVKREGLSALRRANAKVVAGEIPTDELITGILVLVAGAFMLTPGFVTDAVGLLLLFPPSRALLRRRLRSRFAAGPILIGQRFGAPNGWQGTGPGPYGAGPFGTGSPGPGGGDIVDADSWEEPDPRPELE